MVLADDVKKEEKADMLLKRAAWFWKRGLVVISLVMLFGIGGVVIHFQKKLQLGKQKIMLRLYRKNLRSFQKKL